MKKFIHKYVERFKDLKNALNTNNLKMMQQGGLFCDGKELISNSFLVAFGYNLIEALKQNYNNTGSPEFFFDSNYNYSSMVGYYMYKNLPDDDSREYYFQLLADLSKVNSYPQLPVPNGVAPYSEWLGSFSPLPNGSPHAKRPECIQIRAQSSLSGVLQPGYANADIVASNPQDSVGQNSVSVSINDYVRPGLKNIYFRKGFATNNDLRKGLNGDLSIYDGNTPDPTNPSEDYPRISHREYITSSSDYHDVSGVKLSTTPYTPYSYKDFLFRLEATATNPKPQGAGVIKYDYRLRLDFSHPVVGGPAYILEIFEYRCAYIGINVNMSPLDVYNHCQNILNTPNWIIPNTPSGFGSVQPQITTVFSPPPGWSSNYDPSIPWITPDNNPYSNYLSGYSYTQNNLPSAMQYTLSEKISMMGKVGMNNTGVDNCSGCEWGCYWDWKTEQKICSKNLNRAFPFKTEDDCKFFRLLYPDYLCEKSSTNNQNNTAIINTGILTNEPTNIDDPGTTTVGTLSCNDPCCQKPFVTPGVLQSTNFCISEFRLYHSSSVWNQFFPGTSIPSDFQPSPNNTLSVGTSLKIDFCEGQYAFGMGHMLEKWNPVNSTWDMIFASNTVAGAHLANPSTGTFRVSLFASNVLPKPGAVLQPVGYNGMYNSIFITLPPSNLVDQAYIKVKSVQNLISNAAGSYYDILEEQPLTYMDVSTVKFPSCSPDVTNIDDGDYEVPG